MGGDVRLRNTRSGSSFMTRSHRLESRRGKKKKKTVSRQRGRHFFFVPIDASRIKRKAGDARKGDDEGPRGRRFPEERKKGTGGRKIVECRQTLSKGVAVKSSPTHTGGRRHRDHSRNDTEDTGLSPRSSSSECRRGSAGKGMMDAGGEETKTGGGGDDEEDGREKFWGLVSELVRPG